jgi:hypothetical protein
LNAFTLFGAMARPVRSNEDPPHTVRRLAKDTR